MCKFLNLPFEWAFKAKVCGDEAVTPEMGGMVLTAGTRDLMVETMVPGMGIMGRLEMLVMAIRMAEMELIQPRPPAMVETKAIPMEDLAMPVPTKVPDQMEILPGTLRWGPLT